MSTAWDTVKAFLESLAPELVPAEVAVAKDAVIAVEHLVDPEVAKVPILGPELVSLINSAIDAEAAKIEADLAAELTAANAKADAARSALADKRQQVAAVAG